MDNQSNISNMQYMVYEMLIYYINLIIEDILIYRVNVEDVKITLKYITSGFGLDIMVSCNGEDFSNQAIVNFVEQELKFYSENIPNFDNLMRIDDIIEFNEILKKKEIDINLSNSKYLADTGLNVQEPYRNVDIRYDNLNIFVYEFSVGTTKKGKHNPRVPFPFMLQKRR